jgi:hypothetical protein
VWLEIGLRWSLEPGKGREAKEQGLSQEPFTLSFHPPQGWEDWRPTLEVNGNLG